MNEQNRPGNFFTIHCRTVSVTGKGEGTVDYEGKAREFISDSTEEIRRLEREIDRIREIVVRLERYLDEADRLGNLEPPTPRNPLPSPPSYVPRDSENTPRFPGPPTEPLRNEDRRQEKGVGVDKNPDDKIAGSVLRPVGEVAEELLRARPEGMSLDELYRIMVGRGDIPSSRDLKNAIRVSLIRRRPQIVSPRRGWFRWEDPGN